MFITTKIQSQCYFSNFFNCSLEAPRLFFHVSYYQFQQGSSFSLKFHNDGNNERKKKGDDNSQKEIKSKGDKGK
jgi:hypothetical protein